MISLSWTLQLVVAPITKPYGEWLCNYCAMGNLYQYGPDSNIHEFIILRHLKSVNSVKSPVFEQH